MRKLDETELKILDTLRKRKKVSKHLFQKKNELKVQYKTEGNTTLVVIEGTRLPLLGYAKFNPTDAKAGLTFNEEIGKRIAFTRAFK